MSLHMFCDGGGFKKDSPARLHLLFNLPSVQQDPSEDAL
jgi:hypothetical protein